MLEISGICEKISFFISFFHFIFSFVSLEDTMRGPAALRREAAAQPAAQASATRAAQAEARAEVLAKFAIG